MMPDLTMLIRVGVGVNHKGVLGLKRSITVTENTGGKIIFFLQLPLWLAELLETVPMLTGCVHTGSFTLTCQVLFV